MQKTVEAALVNTAEITLDAADLPDYIAALPRLLTVHYIINVNGTLDVELPIVSLHGPGGIRIVAKTLGNCGFRQPVHVKNCSTTIQFWNMTFQQNGVYNENEAMLDIENSNYVRVVGSEFAGLDQTIRAAACGDSSSLLLENCIIRGFGQALFVGRCSTAFVLGNEDDFYDNSHGVHVWYGGLAYLIAPDLLGGSANIKYGGLIVKANGTLL